MCLGEIDGVGRWGRWLGRWLGDIDGVGRWRWWSGQWLG